MSQSGVQSKSTSSAASKDAAKATDKSATADIDIDLLEEDDEFEEFAIETWNAEMEDTDDPKLWGTNWDDDDIDDTFLYQLRQELKKSNAGTGAATGTATAAGANKGKK